MALTEPGRFDDAPVKDADNQAQIIGGGIVALIVAVFIRLLFVAGGTPPEER